MAEREGRLDDHKSWPIRRLVRLGTAPLRGVLVALAVLLGLLGLWMIWVGISRWTVPAASQADLRDVPADAKWQVRDNRRKLQNDARTTLLQGLGGAAVLAGAATAYRQLRIAREGQVTERFTRAIDQLGNDNVDVRLGGIYALGRVSEVGVSREMLRAWDEET
jgi:hypothetical protein